MNNTEFYVGELCEINNASYSNTLYTCNNECSDPGTGGDECFCEDF